MYYDDDDVMMMMMMMMMISVSCLQALMKRIEESTVALAEFEATNKRMMSENSNLYTR